MFNLGQQFATRIGTKLDEADVMMSGGNALRLKELQSGTSIPEGETLIMRGLLNKAVHLDGDILAMRHDGKLLISLSDFCTALELPINASVADGTASGWFMSEGNVFALDAKKNAVTLAGKPVQTAPSDIFVNGSDIMVSTDLLERAFGIGVDFDISSLNLLIKTTTPLPIETKEKRAHEQKYQSGTGNDTPKLPLVPEPYHAFTKPYFDVSMGGNITRLNNDSPTEKSANWSVVGAGDLLGFSSRTFASGNWNSQGSGNTLGTLRQTFGREDPDGKLLGPVGAKSLQFGDVDTINLPLVGGGAQEQGIYLSNQLPGAVTTLSHMDIKGDGQPGWDVELYNNESLLGIQTIGDDGRYDFQQVFLFEGDNIMRLVFYGPQGQTHEETRRVVSTASTLAAGQGKWETSLSRTNKTTYNAAQGDQPNDGDPHLVARYEYSLGPQASVHAGVAHESLTDGTIAKEKDFLQAGGAANFMGALLTADAAYDVDGAYMTDLLARRSFGAHQMGLDWTHSSGGFAQGSLNGFASPNTVTADLRGPLADSFLGLSHLTYTADAGYTQALGGGDLLEAGGTVSAYYKTFGVSQGMHYTETRASPTSSNDVTGTTTFSGYVGKGRWRFTSNYDVQPFDLQTLAANYTYPTSPTLEWIGDLTRTSSAASDLTQLALSARWRPDKVSVTPRIAVDTNHQLALGVNLNFGLADNPYGDSYTMFNRSITTTGGVAARVFLDKNGDGVYDAGDELLPDVDVQSLQASGRARTNKAGIAFMPTLQQSLRTDVIVQPQTLPDPYYITATEGYSVRPRPGITSRLDFPVVVAGEMDGTVSFDGDSDARVHGVTIKLMAPDGRVEKSSMAGSDGYYSISTIHPGVYYLVAETADGAEAGTVKPKMLVFKPEGSTFFGENIALAGGTSTGFLFRAINALPNAANPMRVITPEDIEAQGLRVHFGEYRSRIALTLGWYRFKLMSEISDAFTPDKKLDDIVPDPKTGLLSIILKPARSVTMAEALDACHALSNNAYKCAIELATKWREPVAPEQAAAAPDKKPADLPKVPAL